MSVDSNGDQPAFVSRAICGMRGILLFPRLMLLPNHAIYDPNSSALLLVRGKLVYHVGDHAVPSPVGAVLVTSPVTGSSNVPPLSHSLNDCRRWCLFDVIYDPRSARWYKENDVTMLGWCECYEADVANGTLKLLQVSTKRKTFPSPRPPYLLPPMVVYNTSAKESSQFEHVFVTENEYFPVPVRA